MTTDVGVDTFWGNFIIHYLKVLMGRPYCIRQGEMGLVHGLVAGKRIYPSFLLFFQNTVDLFWQAPTPVLTSELLLSFSD